MTFKPLSAMWKPIQKLVPENSESKSWQGYYSQPCPKAMLKGRLHPHLQPQAPTCQILYLKKGERIIETPMRKREGLSEPSPLQTSESKMLGGCQVSTSSASLSAVGPSLLHVPGRNLKGTRLRHHSRFSRADPPGPSPSPLLPTELHSLGCPVPPSPTSLEKEFLTRSPSNHKSRPLRCEARARWTITRRWHLSGVARGLSQLCPGHSTSQKRSP